MEAQNLNCPNCGAALASDAPQCLYCGSKLATATCPSCFGLMFAGSRHCPHCGVATATAQAAPLTVLKCPRCRADMASVTIGATQMRECGQCAGLWVEAAVFEQICADREQQSAVLGSAHVAHPVSAAPSAGKISYAPCPQCGQLMNRLNFAHCSGVIVDVCKGHGTWFDPDELREIVEFIRGGGMEVSRQKEKLELESARAQFRDEQLRAATRSDLRAIYHSDEDRLGGLSSASGLLKFLLG